MYNLSGKTISILGASTSTFDGFSNSAQYNSTLTINPTYFPRVGLVSDVSDTWWMKTIKELDLRLCVNNSWSGSCVTIKSDELEKAACMIRSAQLHNDNLNIEPDIIILMIGGNDALRGYDVGPYNGICDVYDESSQSYIGDCTLFGQAYATMVHKVKNRYPNADVFVCSMLHWKPRNHNKDLTQYNDVIKKIAEEFKLAYIDLYNETEISPETEQLYLHGDGIHPNKIGFSQMSDCVVGTLKKYFQNH